MTPIHSLEAEQYAIGSILIDETKVVQLIEVPEDHFYRAEHKAIHRAVSDLFGQSMPVDLFSLQEHLDRTQSGLGVDWMAYLTELAENIPSTTMFDSYVNSLADYAKRREVSTAIQNVGMQLENGADVGDIVDYMQDAVVGLASQTMTGGLTAWRDVLGIAMDRIEQRQTHPGQLSGQSTGYDDLDRMLDGFEDGKVYVVAGRTSMGKSAFTLQLLYLLAQSEPWAVFSLEMTDASIGMRALSNASNLFTNKLKANPTPMGDADVAAYAAGISRAKSYNIHVDTTPNLAVAQIRARLKVQVLKHGPVRGIVIDHIGLIKNPKGMSRTEGMSAIAHELQSLAKEFNCPLIELVQINRGAEHEKDRRPSLHQLKQSGAIEEDADVVMLLYRDEYYDSDTDQPGVTEVQIAKNRDGETGIIGFQSSMATGRYTEIGEMDPPKKSRKVKGADL